MYPQKTRDPLPAWSYRYARSFILQEAHSSSWGLIQKPAPTQRSWLDLTYLEVIQFWAAWVHQHVGKLKGLSFFPSHFAPGRWMTSNSLKILQWRFVLVFTFAGRISWIIPIFSRSEFSYHDFLSTFVEHSLSSTWQEIWSGKEVILLYRTDLRIFNKNSPKPSCTDTDGTGHVGFKLN